MVFEEDFPSLKLKIRPNEPFEHLKYSDWTMERLLEDIQQHCIDKQKVKKAFENFLNNCSNIEPQNNFDPIKIFNEELGLENKE